MDEPTIVQQLEASEAKAASLSEQLATVNASLASLQSTNDANVAALSKNAAEIATLTEKLQVVIAEAEALAASNAKLSERLEDATKRLSLQQFDVIGGRKPLSESGEGGNADGLLKQFAAITDPAERSAFYRKHKEALWREAVAA